MYKSKSNVNKRKLPLWQIILMTIATEFGFANIVVAFYQMSYASLIWYLISALTFFLPLVIIVAEYGAAVKNDHGGFYSWLVDSIGEKWAFIGTFMWLCDFIISMLQIASGQGVNISELLFGSDVTTAWHVGPIGTTGVFSLIAIALILIATYAACHGVHRIAVISSIGGVMSMTSVAIFAGVSVFLIFINHGRLAQPLQGAASFVKSPNPQFQTPMAITAFIVYAIFSYSGIESVSGFIDKLKNPRKTFPKAMIWAASIMTTIYLIGIVLCGVSVNWHRVFGGRNVDIANSIFLLMENLGVYLAHSMGWSASTGEMIGSGFVRFVAASVLLNTIGVVVVFCYSPIKSLIAGSSKDLWPKRIVHFNKNDMPSRAMWYQFAIIAVALGLIALTGKNGANFFTIIIDMNNISSIFPYYFLAVGFIIFKKQYRGHQSIVFIRSRWLTWLAVILFIITMTFGLVTNLFSPIMTGQYMTAFWSFVGPILFFVIALIMYHVGITRRAKRLINENMSYHRSQGDL